MVRYGRVRGLAGLLAGALAGCVGQAEPDVMDESYGCDQGCACTEDTAELLLARAEYEDWVADGALTTGEMTTGAMTTGEMTTGQMTTSEMTTGAMTTGAMTTGEMTTGETSSTGGSEPGELDAAGLTAELCVEMCKHYSAADDWGLGCSVPALTSEGEVRIVCTWTTGCE